jgi:hypothetical protein
MIMSWKFLKISTLNFILWITWWCTKNFLHFFWSLLNWNLLIYYFFLFWRLFNYLLFYLIPFWCRLYFYWLFQVWYLFLFLFLNWFLFCPYHTCCGIKFCLCFGRLYRLRFDLHRLGFYLCLYFLTLSVSFKLYWFLLSSWCCSWI